MPNDNIWAPWRMEYIRQLSALEAPDADTEPPPCFLCQANQAVVGTPQSKMRHVLLNDPRGVILLNRFPYPNGHLLVAPHGHLAELSDLSVAARADLMELTHLAEQLLRAAVNPQGINIGLNLGRCAGAGLPGHLHVHVVPRWAGDTNFITTVGQVRVIPEALEASYDHLSTTLHEMTA